MTIFTFNNSIEFCYYQLSGTICYCIGFSKGTLITHRVLDFVDNRKII